MADRRTGTSRRTDDAEIQELRDHILQSRTESSQALAIAQQSLGLTNQHLVECARSSTETKVELKNLSTTVSGINSTIIRFNWGLIGGLFAICGALIWVVLKLP